MEYHHDAQIPTEFPNNIQPSGGNTVVSNNQQCTYKKPILVKISEETEEKYRQAQKELDVIENQLSNPKILVAEDLERKRFIWQYWVDSYENELMAYYETNDSQENELALEKLILSSRSLPNFYFLLEKYLVANRIADAKSLLATMEGKLKVSEENSETIADIKKVIPLCELKENNAISFENFLALIKIADTYKNQASYIAQHILSNYEMRYPPKPSEFVKTKPILNRQIAKKTTEQDILKVYPNPSNGEVTFYFDSKGIDSEVNLFVFDNLGQIVNQVKINRSNDLKWNLTIERSGMYYYKAITDDGVQIATGKLIITK